jgi:TATA-box binding protein (TBP) (component of TFIID and TFIIIB)
MSASMSCSIKQASLPIVKNYKISFRLPIRLQQPINSMRVADIDSTTTSTTVTSVKKHHNFAVIRTKGCVYIAFFSGFVNVTKLRTLTDAEEAVLAFKSLIGFKDIEDKGCPLYIIDNIIASGHFGHTVNIHNLRQICAADTTSGNIQDIDFSYKPAYFAGAFLKLRGCGTILIFHSGAYSIVGAKSYTGVKHIFCRALELLRLQRLPQ